MIIRLDGHTALHTHTNTHMQTDSQKKRVRELLPELAVAALADTQSGTALVCYKYWDWTSGSQIEVRTPRGSQDKSEGLQDDQQDIK